MNDGLARIKMPSEFESIGAGIYLYGDSLDPDVVSSTLSAVPTRAWRKGDTWSSKSGAHGIRETGLWSTRVNRAKDALVGDEDLVKELLERINTSGDLYERIPGLQDAQVALLIMCDPDKGKSGGFCLTRHSVGLIAKLGLRLSIELTPDV